MASTTRSRSSFKGWGGQGHPRVKLWASLPSVREGKGCGRPFSQAVWIPAQGRQSAPGSLLAVTPIDRGFLDYRLGCGTGTPIQPVCVCKHRSRHIPPLSRLLSTISPAPFPEAKVEPPPPSFLASSRRFLGHPEGTTRGSACWREWAHFGAPLGDRASAQLSLTLCQICFNSFSVFLPFKKDFC